MGQHMTKAWSATQASLALSSGEAEYYGVVRATGVGLGIQALFIYSSMPESISHSECGLTARQQWARQAGKDWAN